MFGNLPVTDPLIVAKVYPLCQTAHPTEARHEIVRQYMRLAISIAKHLAPRKSETAEFVAEAMLALVIAADKITHIEGTDPKAFFATAIRRRLYDLRISNRMFSVHRGTHARRTAKGLAELEIIPSAEMHVHGRTTHGYSMVEIREILEMCHLTPQEQQILDYRLAGMSDPEIGEALSLSRERIRQVRVEIGKKWNRSTNESAAA